MVELWKFGGEANTVLEEDLKLKQAGTSMPSNRTWRSWTRMIGRLVWYIIYKCDLSIEGERVTRKKLKKIKKNNNNWRGEETEWWVLSGVENYMQNDPEDRRYDGFKICVDNGKRLQIRLLHFSRLIWTWQYCVYLN